MAASCSHLRPSLTGPNPQSGAREAARLGAAGAFGRTAPTSKTPSTTSMSTYGALVAAAAAGSRSKAAASPPPRQLKPVITGGRTRNRQREKGDTVDSDAVSIASSRSITPALCPARPMQPKASSPSRTAASLAAARAPPTTMAAGQVRKQTETRGRRPAAPPKPRVLSEHVTKSEVSWTNPGGNDGPIEAGLQPPTATFTDLFERTSKTALVENTRPRPVIVKSTDAVSIKSPKPARTSSGGLASIFRMEVEDAKQTPTAEPDHSERALVLRQDTTSSVASFTSASENLTVTQSPSSIEGPGASTIPHSKNPHSLGKGSSSTSTDSNSLHPLQQAHVPKMDVQQHKSPPLRSATIETGTGTHASGPHKSIPAQFHHMYPRHMAPQMSGDQLANAMVASSVASSRASSPYKMTGPAPPPRRQRHHKLTFSRTPSPSKHGMRQTLRKADHEESSDSEGGLESHPYGKHKRKHIVRKHPNKHHEGDRKRWREAVTEIERKRYEGVWAANKGLYYSFTLDEVVLMGKSPDHPRIRELQEAALDQVSNIITRDIWSRSRLPDATLEIVWSLVDTSNVGRLHKEEFVVGMWLIDQRLKGRKLPVKVSDTLWASVRGLQGIKIRK